MTKAALAQVHTDLGRKGKMPWLRKRFMRMLPYIQGDRIVLMLVAHMLLHGLCKDLFMYALTEAPENAAPHNQVMFNGAQRRPVKVHSPHLLSQ